ncbi:MAG: hypothetical protein M3O00_12580 [Pseudomonadota bacterium]|jgi:hypothetical protein|nr:hypothetical protein [Pseudomonadota bacterium]
MDKPEIIVVERHASVAHPSFATGGFILLTPGANAYRNADMIPGSASQMLEWCSLNGCDRVGSEGERTSSLRHRIQFPDTETLSRFQKQFGRKST